MSDEYDSLDSVIGRYLELAEAGCAPDRAAFLAEHPRHREGLLSFFADDDGMQAALGGPRPVVTIEAGSQDERADERYRIVGEIARGGMGAVLRAVDVKFDRPVALKVLREDRDDPILRRRFLFEARVAGSLQHPGIPPVHEVGRLPDGRMFLAMKLIEGETLSDLLEKRPNPSHELSHYLGVFGQVCQTLAYAHSRGIIHRDLKPLNVMVGAFGEVQVMDWGMARRLPRRRNERPHDFPAAPRLSTKTAPSPRGDDSETVTFVANAADPDATVVPEPSSPDSLSQETTDERLTRGGDVMGTLAYMPPEQACGEINQLDERSDVFGLGAMLCHILTGQAPYRPREGAPLLAQAQLARLEDAFARLDASGADREVIALAKECLSARREARPEDAGVIARRLTQHLQTVQQRLEAAKIETAAATARSESERRRRRLGQLLAMILVLAAFGVAAASTWYFQDRAARVAEKDSRRRIVEEQLKSDLNEALRDLKKFGGELEDPAGYRRIADDPAAWTRALTAAEALVKKSETVASTGGTEIDPKIQERIGVIRTALNGSEFQRKCAVDMETLRFSVTSSFRDRASLERSGPAAASQFETTLRNQGFDLGNPYLLAKILDHPLRYAAIDTFDFWAVTEPDPKKRARLLEVSRAADPDEWRTRVRDESLWDDLETLEELAASPEVAEQPPGIAQVLALLIRRADGDPRPLLRRAISASPRDYALHYMLAMSSDDATETIGAYRAALAVRPDSSPAHDNLARQLAQGGDHEGALFEFRESLRIQSGNAATHNNIGFTLLQLNRLAEAEEHLQTAIRLQPQYANAYNNLGLVLEASGRHEEAAGEYRKALVRSPSHANAKLNLERVEALLSAAGGAKGEPSQ